jgi:hypothetical protein
MFLLCGCNKTKQFEVTLNLSNADGEYQYFRLEITDNQPWLLISEFKFTF